MASPKEDERRVKSAVKHWCDSGLAEHSSVAGFSKVLVGLYNVNASSTILRATQNAALDEIKHAKLCFGLANAIRVLCGDRKDNDSSILVPGPLPVKPIMKVHTSLAEVAAASTIEGWYVFEFSPGGVHTNAYTHTHTYHSVEETLSAFLAAVALDALPASDSHRYIPRVGDKISFVLNHITNDESRHASLAWYTVRWCLEEERKNLNGAKGDVHRSVYEAFQRVFREADDDDDDEEEEEEYDLSNHDNSMWPYGILSNRTESFVQKLILRDVLRPWANALLNFRALPTLKTSLMIDSQTPCVHTNRVLNSILSMETNGNLLNLDAKFSDEAAS